MARRCMSSLPAHECGLHNLNAILPNRQGGMLPWNAGSCTPMCSQAQQASAAATPRRKAVASTPPEMRHWAGSALPALAATAPNQHPDETRRAGSTCEVAVGSVLKAPTFVPDMELQSYSSQLYQI